MLIPLKRAEIAIKEQSVNSLGLILGIGGAVLAGACVTAAVKIMRKKQ